MKKKDLKIKRASEREELFEIFPLVLVSPLSSVLLKEGGGGWF